jgi:hypothetical protein
MSSRTTIVHGLQFIHTLIQHRSQSLCSQSISEICYAKIYTYLSIETIWFMQGKFHD